MLFAGNYHSSHAFFNNQTRVFEGKEVMLLYPSSTSFATHFLLMMHTLFLKDSLRGGVYLQDFIALNSSNGEETVAMIKYDQSFNQRHILINVTNPLLLFLSMADSNYPYMYTVLMHDGRIIMQNVGFVGEV